MSKEVRIPISQVDKFVTDGTYIGLALRYRLKNPNDSSQFSQWSPINLLKFTPFYSNDSYTITRANGYGTISTPSRGGTSFNYAALNIDAELPSSQIDQISSQSSGTHVPERDTYKYSWSTPTDCNVKNFDVYTSWNIFSYLATTGTLSAPSGAGPYTGTLTLTANAYNAAITLKSFYDVTGPYNDVKIYGGPGTATPGNSFVMTGYGSGNIINIRSASTWSATGTIKNISRSHAWTDFEYIKTSSESSVTFERKMTSNKLTATITSGSNVVRVNESLIESGVVPGMTLNKISGDGEFNALAVISQINYENTYGNDWDNSIIVSEYQLANSVAVAGTSTIGTVVSNSATITLASAYSFKVGMLITATAGTGSLGNGVVKVTAVNSSTSITVQSSQTITTGNITAITIATPSNHTTSGYIEFVAVTNTVNNTYSSGSTTITADPASSSNMPIIQYWAKPMFVQAIAVAATDDKTTVSTPSEYTLFAVSEGQSTYFDGYGVVGTIAGSGPYTARLTGMNLPYSANIANVGAKLYGGDSSVSTGTVALGNSAGAPSGETKIADYVSGVRTDLMNTTTFTAGTVVSLRV